MPAPGPGGSWIDDRVNCMVCNKPFKHITITHLDIHKISMEEYLIKFPGANLTCNSKRQKHSKIWSGKKNPEHSKRMLGTNNPNYGGMSLTYESHFKMSNKAKGRVPWNKNKEWPEMQGKNNPQYGKPAYPGSGHGKWCMTLKGHYVRSTWEKKVCDWLYLHNVEYEYECRIFELKDDDGEFTYIPDLYIPEIDSYWEIKGRWQGNDIRKVTAFKKLHPNLVIIMEKDMKPFNNVVTEVSL